MVHFKNSGPSISENDIASFERSIGIRLPSEYASFLRTTNGGQPEPDLFRVPACDICSISRLHFLFGINHTTESHSLEWILEMPSERIPGWVLPIGRTEGADIVCLAISGLQSGNIYLWDGYDSTGQSLYFISSSFHIFISTLFSKEEMMSDVCDRAGTRLCDFDAANQASGYVRTPVDMVWHHHQDGVTMQLVPWPIYFRTMHTGWVNRE